MEKIKINYYYKNTFPKTNKMGAKTMTTFMKILPTKVKFFSINSGSP